LNLLIYSMNLQVFDNNIAAHECTTSCISDPKKMDEDTKLAEILELLISDTGVLFDMLCNKEDPIDLLHLIMSCKMLSIAVKQGIKNKYKCGMGLSHFNYKVQNDSISTSKQKIHGQKCENVICNRDTCLSCVYICASKKCHTLRCSYCVQQDFLYCSGPTCPKKNKYYCRVCGLDITNPRLTKNVM